MWYNDTIIHLNDLEGVRRDKVVQATYMSIYVYCLFSIVFIK